MLSTILIKENHLFSFPSAINHILAGGKSKKKTNPKNSPPPWAVMLKEANPAFRIISSFVQACFALVKSGETCIFP